MNTPPFLPLCNYHLINASQAFIYLEGAILFTGITGYRIIAGVERPKSAVTCHGKITF